MQTDSKDFRSGQTWQAIWSKSLRTAEDLKAFGFISELDFPAYERLLATYRFTLPLYYAQLIDRNNPHCPIRRQAIPALEELETDPGLVEDPLEDRLHRPAPRITHRYDNRALLHLTANCSMDCRYCFRKFFLNEGKRDLFGGEILSALNYLKENTRLAEVIFSGGDPLMASDDFLSEMVQALGKLDHIQRIRFHTRVPVTFPMRITDELVRSMGSEKTTVIVTHFNHPKELTLESKAACAKFSAAGFRLFNQSVLLTGVNNHAETLAELSEGLFAAGITPYYLHHPDRAAGTRHFSITMQEGLQIYEELRSRVSGYLVPRYVIDDPKSPYKKDVSEYLTSLS